MTMASIPWLTPPKALRPLLTVDLHLAVRDDGADLALLNEVVQALAGKGAVDLESVDKGGDGDETVGLDVLVQLVRGGLVEDDGVLGLVLDCVEGADVSDRFDAWS